jgi:hypothetical protein
MADGKNLDTVQHPRASYLLSGGPDQGGQTAGLRRKRQELTMPDRQAVIVGGMRTQSASPTARCPEKRL